MKPLNPIIDLILETRYVCSKILMEQEGQIVRRGAEIGLEWAAEQLSKLLGKGAEQAATRAGVRGVEAAIESAEDDLIKLWAKAQSQGLKLPSDKLEEVVQETIYKVVRQSVQSGASNSDEIISTILKRNPELIENPKAVDAITREVDSHVSKLQQELTGDLPKIISYKFDPRTPQETPAVKYPEESPKTSPFTVEPTTPATVEPAKPATIEPPASPKVDIGLQPDRKPTAGDVQKFVDTLFRKSTTTEPEAPPTTFPPDWKPLPITPRTPLPGEEPVEVPPQFDPNRPFWRPGPVAPPKAPPVAPPVAPPAAPPVAPPEAPPEAPPVAPPVAPPKIPIIPEPEPKPKPKPKTPKAPPEYDPRFPIEVPQQYPITEPDVIPSTVPQPEIEPITTPTPEVDPQQEKKKPKRIPKTDTKEPPNTENQPDQSRKPPPGDERPPGRSPTDGDLPIVLPFLSSTEYGGKAKEESGKTTPIDLGLGIEAIGTYAKRQILR